MRRPSTVPMSRRAGALGSLAVVAAMVAVTACRVDARVAIDVAPDGSGEVAVTVDLDADAAEQLGDPQALRLDDLVEAGWAVDDPDRAGDGSLSLRAVREFASPEQLPQVLEEVGGADAIFRDVSLSVVDGFTSTEYDLDATVDLSGTPEQFSDDALAELLGSPLGRSPEQLLLLGAADPESYRLGLRVDLPGEVSADGAEQVDGAAEWDLAASGGEPSTTPISATSSTSTSATWVLLGLAAVAAALAVGAGIVAVRRR